MKVIPETRHAQ